MVSPTDTIVMAIAAILLVVAAYVLLIPHEPFATSRTAYRNGVSEKERTRMQNRYDDRDDLMQMYRCYQLPLAYDVAKTIEANDVAQVTFTTYTSSMDEARSRIVSEIIAYRDKIHADRLLGPVYVLLSQAPYFVDSQKRPMAVQYHITDYAFKPYNVLNRDSSRPIFLKVTVVFAAYDKKGKARAKISALSDLKYGPMKFADFESRHDICFVECPSEPNSFCGCLTTDKPYKTTCMGPSIANKKKDEPTTFYVAYTINPKYTQFLLNKNVFG